MCIPVPQERTRGRQIKTLLFLFQSRNASQGIFETAYGPSAGVQLVPSHLSLPSFPCRAKGLAHISERGIKGPMPRFASCIERRQFNLALNPHCLASCSVWGSLILSVPHLRSTDRSCVETYVFRLTNK